MFSSCPVCAVASAPLRSLRVLIYELYPKTSSSSPSETQTGSFCTKLFAIVDTSAHEIHVKINLDNKDNFIIQLFSIVLRAVFFLQLAVDYLARRSFLR